MSKAEQIERAEPIKLTDTETGKVYTLEFNRKSVERMERQGFVASSIADFPLTAIPTLFYGAFYKNHPFVPRDQTDKMLYELGEVPGLLSRLSALYNEPIKALLGTDDNGENERKNAKYTVEM